MGLICTIGCRSQLSSSNVGEEELGPGEMKSGGGGLDVSGVD